MLSPHTRHLMKGIEKADSLVWDAHKMLATNTLCAAVLMRKAPNLYGALQQNASYLFHDKDQPGFDFIEHTVECTKAGMGLRLFLVLAAMGKRGIADHVANLFDLGLRAWQVIAGHPGFEPGPRPQSNIVLFRFKASDQTQLELRKRLMHSGEFHISSTLFAGRRYLRLALMNPLTTETTIAALLDRVQTFATDL
jgi:L-2,4-diaminobutyrate decarboxylase